MEAKLVELSEILFKKYVCSDNLKKHSIEVAIIMKELAKKFNEDENLWFYTGLLHDLDYEEVKDLKLHGLKTAEILRELNFPEVMIEAILRHNEMNGNRREALLDYALSAADNISGLIYAYALMRGTFQGMNIKGLRKKFKDKKFAKNVNRGKIKDIEKFCEMSEFFEIAIRAMGSISDEILS